MKDKAAAASEEGISVHQFSLKLSSDNGEVFGQVVKYGGKCDQVRKIWHHLWNFCYITTFTGSQGINF